MLRLKGEPKKVLQEALEKKIDTSIGKMVAGVLMVLQFPLNRFKVHFSNPQNVQDMLSMVTLPTVQKLFYEHKMKFFLKLELGIDLLDVETAEIRENVKFQFPKSGVWGFRLESDIEKFKKTEKEVMENLLILP
eukprot:TRINITY_DN19294_c0_g3_i1.p1 TRINITY_DN19294_c0_g3~~TRINITY_DN19294_c0_g3_i1.p1  ORF type:complete len:134 (-),score=38.82 TRINITY_DN19294_c0_g3_i1:164-565(-)